jgi:hypothetical protein
MLVAERAGAIKAGGSVTSERRRVGAPLVGGNTKRVEAPLLSLADPDPYEPQAFKASQIALIISTRIDRLGK